MTYACPKCQIELRVKQNGVGVETISQNGPYQFYQADLIECPGCHLEVLAGFGRQPILYHYQQPAYDRLLSYQRATNLVYRIWFNLVERDRYREKAG